MVGHRLASRETTSSSCPSPDHAMYFSQPGLDLSNFSVAMNQGMAGPGWNCGLDMRAVLNGNSAFESARSSWRQFDNVFRSRFFSVLFERQLNELVNQLRKGNSAGFPQLWIHAYGREARNRVHFIEIDFPAVFLQEKI